MLSSLVGVASLRLSETPALFIVRGAFESQGARTVRIPSINYLALPARHKGAPIARVLGVRAVGLPAVPTVRNPPRGHQPSWSSHPTFHPGVPGQYSRQQRSRGSSTMRIAYCVNCRKANSPDIQHSHDRCPFVRCRKCKEIDFSCFQCLLAKSRRK